MIIDKQMDFYEILCVPRDATLSQIKKSYKHLVLKFHPDVNKEKNSSEVFKKISKAYIVLKNNNLRKEYNKFIDDGSNFNRIVNFKYYFKKVFNATNNIANNFKLLFKNIGGQRIQDFDYKNELNLSFGDVNLSREIIALSDDELNERIKYSQNKFVRLNAVLALGYKKSKKSYFILEKYILDSDPDVRKAIIWAIGNLRMKKSLNVLKIMYNSFGQKYLLNIIFAVFKISNGKDDFFYRLAVDGLNSREEFMQVQSLKLLIASKRNVFVKDIEMLINNISEKVRELVEVLIEKKQIIK